MQLPRQIRLCSVEGCERKHRTNGYCVGHVSQWRTHGRIVSVQLRPKNKNGMGRAKPYVPVAKRAKPGPVPIEDTPIDPAQWQPLLDEAIKAFAIDPHYAMDIIKRAQYIQRRRDSARQQKDEGDQGL